MLGEHVTEVAGREHSVSLPAVVFDIDGTLTDTNEVDHEWYVAAVYEVLGQEVGEDWAGVEDVTDATILRELWRRERAGPLPETVEQGVMARFVDLLEREARARPHRFRPVPGAREVFDLVCGRGWASALATGGWRPSAELKLRSASIPFDGVPLASASDHVGRADIIRRALDLVGRGRDRPRGAVYVGDRPWDLRAARTLGMSFIGVATGAAADRLRDAGALVVIDDLGDARRLEALIESGIRTAGLDARDERA